LVNAGDNRFNYVERKEVRMNGNIKLRTGWGLRGQDSANIGEWGTRKKKTKRISNSIKSKISIKEIVWPSKGTIRKKRGTE